MKAPVTVRPVEGPRDLKAFLRVPHLVFRDDPAWVAPLTLERREHLDPRRNPFFNRAEAAFWIAWDGDRPIGRISAQVNHAHLERHGDSSGHFGFLDAIDDPAVFRVLFETAEAWIGACGLSRLTGPFSLSINDETGLLVDGFDAPPSLMMGHAWPYYRHHVEAAGYRKATDVIAYHVDLAAPLPPRTAALFGRAARIEGIVLRPLDMRRFESEIATVVDIFNDAWSDNWGFVPFSAAEVDHLARSLKLLIRPSFCAMAEHRGEPVAMAISLPNLNAAIRDLGGRLMPFGWARLLWRLKVAGVSSTRMPLMGVRRRYHNSALGAVLAYGVIGRVYRAHKAAGTRETELSWILEDNRGMRHMMEAVGARPYKTYRIFTRDLA